MGAHKKTDLGRDLRIHGFIEKRKKEQTKA